jgi:hypothetical protein
MSDEAKLDAVLVDELRSIKGEINKYDEDSVLARWKCGHRILAHYPDGKNSLPKGTLDAIAKALGIVRSEVGARVKFARQYTEAQVNTDVESGISWTEIRQKKLTTKPRPRADSTVAVSPLRRVLNPVATIAPETLRQGDRALPLIASVDFLGELAGRVVGVLGQNGQRIAAIKLVRRETGIGLKEAADFVDAVGTWLDEVRRLVAHTSSQSAGA